MSEELADTRSPFPSGRRWSVFHSLALFFDDQALASDQASQPQHITEKNLTGNLG
jgi:hypothetical protein